MAIIDSLVSYYKLDEASGNAIDSHGPNTGTSVGITYGNTGILNNSFTFAASSSDRVDTFTPTGTAFTWNIWVYFTSSPSSSTYRALSNSNFSTAGVDIGFGSGVPRIFLSDGVSSQFFDASFDFDGHEDEWHMLTLTYDDSDHTARVYVDGDSENTLVLSDDLSWGSNNILIGNRINLDRGFPGRLDEVGIWDGRLSPAEVSELYNSGNGLAYPFTTGIAETDTTTLSENLEIARGSRQELITETDTTTLSDNLTIARQPKIIQLDISDTTTLDDDLTISSGIATISLEDTATLSDNLTLIPKFQFEGITTTITINGVIQQDVKASKVDRSQNEFNTVSSFSIDYDNFEGRHNDDFSINQEVNITASLNGFGTCQIINGIIDDIDFSGKGTTEILTISGREFGSVLQDIIVNPRIFKDTEVSEIVLSLMSQNISNITTNNVNTTTTEIPKITFTNISVYDALVELAEIAGFYFYVDVNKDLHFEQKNSISTGRTLDNTNTTAASFVETDQDQYTKVTVQGDRQLTAAESIQTTGTDNTGSVYVLTSKPYNTSVILSGPTDTLLHPGGVININDPETENVKYLVDFQGQRIILTSGTASGDNIQPNGSVVKFNYQESTPLVSIKQNPSPFPKHKIITDGNIKDINEAALKAQTFLNEHSQPKISGDNISVKGVIGLTPGHTIDVNFPNQGQDNKTYAITNVKYDFNPTNNDSKEVMSLNLNRKTSNFVDLMKEQILRLRALESSETDSSITNVELGSSLVGVVNNNLSIATSIGSAFYFNVPGHDILNSPTSLLGDMRTGSVVFQNGVQI